MGMGVRRRNLDTIIDCRMRHPQALVDSAPGHQETPKPPSGGFFIYRYDGFVACNRLRRDPKING